MTNAATETQETTSAPAPKAQKPTESKKAAGNAPTVQPNRQKAAQGNRRSGGNAFRPMNEQEINDLVSRVTTKIRTNPRYAHELNNSLKHVESRSVAFRNAQCNMSLRVLQDLDRVMYQCERRSSLDAEMLREKHSYELRIVAAHGELAKLAGEVAHRINRQDDLMDSVARAEYKRLEAEQKAKAQEPKKSNVKEANKDPETVA